MTNEKSFYITLSKAAKLCPGRPHASAVWRWCRKGLKSRSGDTVRLKHIRAGGRIYTTANWLYQFFNAVTEADSNYFDGQSTFLRRRKNRKRKSSKRQHEINCARDELEEARI